MPTQTLPAAFSELSDDEFIELRLEALGFIFHGTIPDEPPKAKKPSAKSNTNLLHFAKCSKLEKIGPQELRYWFRTISAAKSHLDTHVGPGHWKWCKVCVRDVTQKILDEN